MSNESRIPEWNQKLQDEAASTFFQFATRLTKHGATWIKQAVQWKRAASAYVSRWIDKRGYIQPLGADHPIPLHQVFVQVCAVPRGFLKRFSNIEEMEADARAARTLGFNLSSREIDHYTPQPGLSVANQYRRLNLLGAPGAGKTTFLRRLGLEALLPKHPFSDAEGYVSQYKHEVIPVLIELRSLRGKSCETAEDVRALIARELLTVGFPESLWLFAAALRRGRLLILFDGVDEIPAERLESAINAIQEFIDLYPRCRYVLSCRTAFYRDWFTGFQDFVLADLNEKQVRAFAQNWFVRFDELQADAAGSFLSLLTSREHQAIRELAGSPLLLTLLCLVFRRTQQFPANRALLYDKALRVYLEEWNASKLVHQDPLYRDVTPEMQVEILKDIAGPAFVQDRYFFTTDDLVASIGSTLRELDAPRSLSPRQVLLGVAIQQGLLIERAQSVWSFSHLTIQEYLAATWVVEEENIYEVVDAHAADARWREIFLLIAGLARADDFLRIILDHAYTLVADDPDLARLWNSVSQYTEIEATRKSGWGRLPITEPPVRNAIIRAHVFTLLIARSRALLHYGIETTLIDDLLCRAEDLCIAIGRVAGPKIANVIAKEIRADTSRYVVGGVDPEFDFHVEFSKGDQSVFGVLARYCQICSLVCDCKRAALRISPVVWEKIINRILAPSTQ